MNCYCCSLHQNLVITSWYLVIDRSQSKSIQELELIFVSYCFHKPAVNLAMQDIIQLAANLPSINCNSIIINGTPKRIVCHSIHTIAWDTKMFYEKIKILLSTHIFVRIALSSVLRESNSKTEKLFYYYIKFCKFIEFRCISIANVCIESKIHNPQLNENENKTVCLIE